MDIVGCQRLFVFLVLQAIGKCDLCDGSQWNDFRQRLWRGNQRRHLHRQFGKRTLISLTNSWIMLLRTITKTLSICATVSVYWHYFFFFTLTITILWSLLSIRLSIILPFTIAKRLISSRTVFFRLYVKLIYVSNTFPHVLHPCFCSWLMSFVVIVLLICSAFLYCLIR